MPFPAGTTRAAILIGVDRTLDLHPLAAAAKGALEMEQWFAAEGYATTSLTDANEGEVRVAGVFDAVEDAIATPGLKVLVVYFSGHGYHSAGTEIWLLSGAPTNPAEAVNLEQSRVAAYASGLENVVFIADTCRSVPQTMAANAVRGSCIFPIQRASKEAQIDIFFATNPGDVAVEVALDAARKDYDGLFTKALKSLHAAAPPEELATVRNGDVEVTVLSNRKLRKLLPDHFVREARAIRAVISQTPALRIESDETFYVARAVAAAVDLKAHGDGKLRPQPFALGDAVVPSLARAASKMISERQIAEPQMIRKPGQNPAELQLSDEARELRSAERDGGFETQCGVMVSGGSISEGLCIGGPHAEVESPGQADNRMRVQNAPGDYGPNRKPGSILVRFAEGTATMLAAIPGYIVNVVLNGPDVISVSYSPAPNSQQWAEFQNFRDQVQERRAIIATAARHNILAMDREDASKFADFIRVGKDIDPTLGLYAALAYANVGLHAKARSVFGHMRSSLNADLFDLWLLAGGDQARSANVPLIPLCPMLSQAWDHLVPRAVELPAVLAMAVRRQSLWTTFTPAAADAIFAAARQGDLG